MPRVTVLLPTHDRADVLGHAIASVLRQTEADFELFVVGDGCTDATAEVVAGFRDPRITWFDLPKAPYYGYANRNIALRRARGDLIAYAAHDDLFLPDHLERLAAEIEAAGADWIYSRPLMVSTDGIIVPFAINLRNADELRDFLERRNAIAATCVMHRRGCLERFGFWAEDVPSGADWEYWKRILGNGGAFAYLPVPTSLHFVAIWKQSRFGRAPVVRAMLEIADTAPWWPRGMKHEVPAGETEQAVIARAMAAGGLDWCSRLRRDVETVVERLAWEYAREVLPRLLRQREEEAARGEAPPLDPAALPS